MSRLRLKVRREFGRAMITLHRRWLRFAGQPGQIVYLFRADRRIRYRIGKSRVVYIGQSKANPGRLLESLRDNARELLGAWGVREVEVLGLRVPDGKAMEKALIAEFKHRMGEPPKGNDIGKGFEPFRVERALSKKLAWGSIKKFADQWFK